MFLLRSAGGRLYNAERFTMIDAFDGPEGSYLVGAQHDGPGEVVAVFTGPDHAARARAALGRVWESADAGLLGCDLGPLGPDAPTPDTYRKCGIEPEPVEERITGAQGTMEPTATGKPGPVGPAGRPWL